MRTSTTGVVTDGPAGRDTRIFLSRDDLKKLGITVSNTTMLRWEAIGRFPRRVRMAGTSVFWLASEIELWVQGRAAEHTKHHYADI